MRLWHQLLTTDIIDACELVVAEGWEADSLLTLNGGAPGRLHVAEVLSRAAARHDLILPPDDGALAFRLRFSRDKVNPNLGGALSRTPDGRLAYHLGDGRVVESTGNTLTVIRRPTADRYTVTYRLPGVTQF